MNISGALDDTGRDLVLTRTVPAPARRIWEHLSRSELLATWYGTFTGDPATGRVQVTMTAEPGEPTTADWTIHACDPERLLSVSSAMGEETWRLSLTLDDADDSDEADGSDGSDGSGGSDSSGGSYGSDGAGAGSGRTRLALRHHDVPREMIEHVGPGWEWYLDRLTGAVTGGDIPGMDVWDSEYMTLSGEYAALTD